MRRLLLALPWLLCAAMPVAAVEIRSYDARLDLGGEGGSRCGAAIHVSDAKAGAFDLPLGFAHVSDLRLASGPTGTILAAVENDGQAVLHAELPAGVATELDLTLEFVVKGALPGAVGDARRVFRHSLLNTQPVRLGRYRFEVIFPDGLRAHAIREVLPRLRKGEAGPRAQLTAIDGRPGARLEVGGLAQGETATLQIELTRRSQSPVWWIAGLILSLLYLSRFRDLGASASDRSS